MPQSLGNSIADSLQRSLDYAEVLQKGITEERFARFAAPSGQVIESNHPAFIFGHLSLYGPRILEYVAGDGAMQTPSDEFLKLFFKTAKCVDDPDGNIYPAMEAVTEVFYRGNRAAVESLRAADDDVLQQANPLVGGLAEPFPTIGSMLAFFAGGHAMMHLGQLSAWRRMDGLPPA